MILKYELFLEKQLSLFPGMEKKNRESTVNKYISSFKNHITNNNSDSDLKTEQDVLKRYNNSAYVENTMDEIWEEDLSEQLTNELYMSMYLTMNIILEYYENSKYELTENEKNEFIEFFENDYNQDYDTNIECLELVHDEESFIDWYVKNHNNWNDVIDKEYYDYIISTLYNSENDKIRVYRALYITDDDEKLEDSIEDYDGIGIFWSWDLDGAEPHGGPGKNSSNQEIILIADVDISKINWEQTFYKSLYGLKDEKEIELFEDNNTVDVVGYILQSNIEDYKKIFDYDYLDSLGLNDNQIWTIIRNMRNHNKEDNEIYLDEPISVKV